ncbi:MAG: glycosyltransferase family 92 protein [Candidatus Limnocylindrales bacterium]
MQRLRGSSGLASPAPRRPTRATPPNVIGKGPLLSTPGLQLGVVVIIRNEAPYLDEWLAYHRALGVDHFFIYDNGSTDELHEVIEPWVNHGLVTLVHWPLPGGQIDAYSHALRFYGPSVAWLAFFDVDEFVVPLVDDDIPSVLARFADAADLRIPRVDFGFSGHREPPDALTIEAYTQVADVFGRDPSKPPRVKSVVQPKSISAVGIHTATVADDPRGPDGKRVPQRTVGRACWEFVQLNHYYTRSFEEFEAKRFRGSATGRIARPAIPFDLPSLGENDAAVRFAGRTRAMSERIHSLARVPYRYGSQLALEQFPRFNDLGLFAEFAIANTVMEEPAPRREPALRIPNLYQGIGFVGVVSGHEHEVREGELSGSMHLQPLLERARGELMATLADAAVREGEAEFSVKRSGERRVYAAGFVVSAVAPTRVEAQLEREDGSRSETVELKLEAGSTYAGVVELEAAPSLANAVRVRLSSTTGEIGVHDVFVIAYG